MTENSATLSDDIPLVRLLDDAGKGDVLVVDIPSILAARGAPLPRVLRAVLENVAAQAASGKEMDAHVAALAGWHPNAPELAVPLAASRVMLPDSSGLPALMDLAAARDVLVQAGQARAG